ncbi:MAG: DUF6198 family protein [Clostridiales bacterium]|jgi:uncharacterized membrane protein YczE|nr:DUF6198 family protein [Clostridiales bacterium]
MKQIIQIPKDGIYSIKDGGNPETGADAALFARDAADNAGAVVDAGHLFAKNSANTASLKNGSVMLPFDRNNYTGTYGYGGSFYRNIPSAPPTPKKRLFQRKPVIYNEFALIFALIFLALGKTLMLKADFGVTAVQSIPLLLSLYFDKLSLGIWNLIVQGLYVLIALCLTHRFKLRYLLAFAVAAVYVVILDFFVEASARYAVTDMTGRIICFALGFFSSALSMTFFFRCHVPLMPYETLQKEIAAKRTISILKVKVPLDILFLSAAVALSYLLFGKIRIEALGIGTVILMFTMSVAILIITYILNKFFEFRCVFDKSEKVYGDIEDY